MTPGRTSLASLAVCGLLLLGLSGAARGEERIVDAASGNTLTPAQLIERLRGSERVLLGERHDNARHHVLRGELIKALGKTRVLAEQLDRGRGFDFSDICINSEHGLERTLKAVGFDEKAWGWALYQPLFSAIATSGSALAGGNITRDQAKAIARDGLAAVPAELAALLKKTPLPEMAAKRLDAELLRGHCGEANEFNADRRPGLQLAQRVRDAAMATTLIELAPPESGKPHVLLAGNGHVRRDHGIPVFLAAHGSRHVVVGFAESEEELAEARREALYHFIWLTEPAKRNDPCLALRKHGASR